jgi:hypothetical protein
MSYPLPWVGHRRLGRRNGERRVTVYVTDELLQLFECTDVDELLAKLREVGILPHVMYGPRGTTLVFVSDRRICGD